MGEVPSDTVKNLHGDLDLKIIAARNLPNMDRVTEHLRRCFTGCDACSRPPRHHDASSADTDADSGGDADEDHRRGRQKKIRHHRRIITSDPYVKVCVPQATLARTRVMLK